MSGWDCTCHLNIVLLVRSCCSQTGGCSSIFGMQDVGPAHCSVGPGLSAGKDVILERKPYICEILYVMYGDGWNDGKDL